MHLLLQVTDTLYLIQASTYFTNVLTIGCALAWLSSVSNLRVRDLPSEREQQREVPCAGISLLSWFGGSSYKLLLRWSPSWYQVSCLRKLPPPALAGSPLSPVRCRHEVMHGEAFAVPEEVAGGCVHQLCEAQPWDVLVHYELSGFRLEFHAQAISWRCTYAFNRN